MTGHPPIPRNCPYFEKDAEHGEYIFWTIPGSWPKEAIGAVGIPMGHEPSIGAWRKTIAIIAEHYWRIQAEDIGIKLGLPIEIQWREWGDKVVKEDEENG